MWIWFFCWSVAGGIWWLVIFLGHPFSDPFANFIGHPFPGPSGRGHRPFMENFKIYFCTSQQYSVGGYWSTLYMGGNRKTQETRCPIVPQVLSSLDSPPSFHIKGSPYACSLCNVQGSSVWVKEEGHFVSARNKSSLIVRFLYCKGQRKCKKVPSRLNSEIYTDKNIGETLSYFRQ